MRGRGRGRERNGKEEGQRRATHRRVSSAGFQWLLWPFREGNVQLKKNWQRARVSSPPMGNLHLIRPDRNSGFEERDASEIQAKAISAPLQ